jgi:multidrug efflux pump subunit AcrA (membrane-fusion protein)
MKDGTKTQLLWGGGILVAAVVVAGVLVNLRGSPPERPPEDRTPLVQTAVVEVRSGPIQVSATGSVTPLAEIQLTPQVSGQVIWVNPSLVNGGRVRAGELLVRIDPADYRNRVRQSQADVAQQEVAVLEAEEEVELARIEYEAFQTRESGREGSVLPGIDDDDYAARIVPPVDTPAARPGSAPQAGADDEGVQAARQGSLLFREPQLDAARAALERAEAGLADARLALERTEIRAPFPALVRSESVDVGSYVAPGQSLAELVAAEGVEVVTPLTRAEAALIPDLWDPSPDAPIEATVFADYGGYRYGWEGTVHRAQAVLDPETRTIDVVIRVPRPMGGGFVVGDPATALDAGELRSAATPPLLVGDFVTATIRGASLDRFVVFPARALRRGDSVWVVRDGVLHRVRVRVLRRGDGDIAAVADAMEPGDRVVVSDLGVATEGMAVRTESASEAVATDSAAEAGASAADGAAG